MVVDFQVLVYALNIGPAWPPKRKAFDRSFSLPLPPAVSRAISRIDLLNKVVGQKLNVFPKMVVKNGDLPW